MVKRTLAKSVWSPLSASREKGHAHEKSRTRKICHSGKPREENGCPPRCPRPQTQSLNTGDIMAFPGHKTSPQAEGQRLRAEARGRRISRRVRKLAWSQDAHSSGHVVWRSHAQTRNPGIERSARATRAREASWLPRSLTQTPASQHTAARNREPVQGEHRALRIQAPYQRRHGGRSPL